MNFDEYKVEQTKILEANPDLIRADCLNPFKAMDFLINDLGGDVKGKSPEDVLDLWKYNTVGFGSLNTVMSNGVRDSLMRLANAFADYSWMIPSDVYPKYLSLTDDVKERSFYRLNDDNPFESCGDFSGVILTECPITPSGRLISESEVDFLCDFVEREGNFVIIDTVYAYDMFAVSNRLWKLVKTGKAFILHSLSKTYLCPEVMGINIVPEKFSGLFDGTQASQEQLDRAFEILTRHRSLPIDQEVIFRRSWSNFMDVKSIGYFRLSNKSFEKYLEDGVLTVPFSVFGGSRDMSVLTVLYSQKALNSAKA